VLRDGMWAVLFTDIVGSTAQRARLGDATGDELRREHDRVVERALTANRGVFVDGTGDGAMCVFASAADAWEAGLLEVVERNSALAEQICDRVPFAVGRTTNLAARAKRALFAGRLDEAEDYAEQTRAAGQGVPIALQLYTAQLATIRCDQGRADELVPLLEPLVLELQETGLGPIARAMFAMVKIEAGDLEAGTRLLETEVAKDLSAQGQTITWYGYHAHWAEVAAELQHEKVARMLHARLLPYTDRIANVGPIARGMVSRLVGRLEIVLRMWDLAEEHLAHAAARHEELGATLFLARTWADQGELLVCREGRARLREADALLERAAALARERGAPGIQRYVDRVRVRAARSA
jgi:hypothetical protein